MEDGRGYIMYLIGILCPLVENVIAWTERLMLFLWPPPPTYYYYLTDANPSSLFVFHSFHLISISISISISIPISISISI